MLGRLAGTFGFPSAKTHPAVAAVSDRATRSRICLVTSEFHGLFKNGGIGTANTGLALDLGERGHEVVVAFVDPPNADQQRKSAAFAAARERYAEAGVTLDLVPPHPRLAPGADDVGWSYSVFAYLEAQGFDIVFFNECGGQGFYSLLAKHAGLFRNPPLMVVAAHGPGEWVHHLNAQLFSGARSIAQNFLERRSIELADVLVSPSRYLVEWMKSQGWTLPARVHVIQNIVPPPVQATARPGPPAPITEIVFFGRQETRKGLPLFCEAIGELGKTRDLSRVGVTIMGKFSRINSVHSGVYLLEKSERWRSSLRIIANFDQAQALDYLSRPGTLAVIPSLAENSPCVVAECLMAGIPFLATNTGGTAELVDPSDRARCLFPPTPAALRARLAEALERGHEPAGTAVPQAETKERYRALVAALPALRSAGRAPHVDLRPRVSVVVAIAADAAHPLERLRPLLDQVYDNFEIVVVVYDAEGRASPVAEASALSPLVKVHHVATPSRAEARNAAAKRATGEFLLFVDEDLVVLNPEGLAGMVGVAQRCEAEAVTSVPLLFRRPRGAPIEGWDGEIGYLPLGACKELAMFENCLGHSAFLIARKLFASLGGFRPDVGRGLDDRLLLTRAVLAGARLEVAPRPLFWLRAAQPRPQETADDQRRVFETFVGEKVSTVARALEGMLASGAQNRERALAELGGLEPATRDMAMRMSFMATPTGTETFKLFVEYALRRGRFREAVDFAALADPIALLPIAESAARAAMEKSARRAAGAAPARVTYAVDLTGDVGYRVRPLSSLRGEAIERGPDRVATFVQSVGSTILKAPAVCPPRTRSAQVSVEAASDGEPGVEVSIAACAPFARLSVVEGRVHAYDGAFWSGWASVPPGPAGALLKVEIPEPLDQSLDLYLISRNVGDVARGARVTWKSVRAEVSVANLETASLVQFDEAAAPLPYRLLAAGELLTDASDFPYPVFVPGKPALHHPLAGRAAIVRIPGAIYPGATGVRAAFSVDLEGARPVEFGFWVRRPDAPAHDLATLEDSLAFSGWTSARKPFEMRQSALTLAEPAEETLDLYLATRVTEFPDVDCCHAMWHEIFVTETLAVKD